MTRLESAIHCPDGFACRGECESTGFVDGYPCFDCDGWPGGRLYPCDGAPDGAACGRLAEYRLTTGDIVCPEHAAAWLRYLNGSDAIPEAIDLPFGLDRPEALLESFCACGHVVSRCDGSRAGCRSPERLGAVL